MAKQLNLPTGYYQATLKYSGTAVPLGAAVVFGGKIPSTGTPTPFTVGGALKIVLTQAGSIYENGGSWSNSLTLSTIDIKFGPLVDGPAATTSVATVAGTGTPPAVSANTAFLVTKQTSLGGHVGRGRMFLPGLARSNVNEDGTVLGSIVTSLQTKLSTTLAAMVTADISMYLLHSYDPVRGESPRAPTLVTSLVASGKAATQRDRMRK